MDKAPIPLPRLVLIVEFDLADVANSSELAGKNHQKACEEAALATGLRPVEKVGARSVTVEGTATTAVAQETPFVNDDDVDLNLDYLYGSDGNSMCMRVAVNLEKVDGVTSLRLGLHTMEIIEGGSAAGVSSVDNFKKNPPFTYGFRHSLNFARMISTTLADFAIARAGGAFLSTLGANGSDEIPNTPASLIAYHSKAKPAPPATYRLFAAKEGAEKPYRQFLSLVELWGQRLGSWGFFVLNNTSPWNVGKVIPSEIKDINDMHSMEKRYAGSFDGAVLPPGDDVWPLNNFYHVRRIFINNYGRHNVAIKAKATAFKWDWIGIGPAVWGAGCAQFNGRFFVWMRGTEAGVDLVKEEAEKSFVSLPSVQQIPKSLVAL